MKKQALLILFIVFLTFSISVEAQCAMCRAVLESEDGQNAAKGFNDGIVYLMIIPYLLVSGIGYIIYRKFFKTKKRTV